MSTLNLNDYTPQMNASPAAVAEQTVAAKKVKSMGVIALILTVCGFIPLLGIFALIAAFIVSRSALTLSRKNLVPIEYEKPAYWASVGSTILLILTAIGIVTMFF